MSLFKSYESLFPKRKSKAKEEEIKGEEE